MTRHRLPWILLGPLALMALTLLACGPAASPDNPSGPVVAQATQELTAQATQEPGPGPASSNPEPPIKTPAPPPTALPTKPPLSTGAPPTPFPEHPEGLEGCKNVGMFQYESKVQNIDWCVEQLDWHIINTCRNEQTLAVQRECGDRIADEYRHFVLRLSAIRCGGLPPGSGAMVDCIRETTDDTTKALRAMFEGWRKVAIAGNRDPAVIAAMKEVVTCLEGQEFEKVDQDLLFDWQVPMLPDERKALAGRLSEAEKALTEELLDPSRTCGKQHGLFDAQDAAWARELRTIDKEEPQTVADLIKEGLLDALEKPGTASFLTGDAPW